MDDGRDDLGGAAAISVDAFAGPLAPSKPSQIVTVLGGVPGPNCLFAGPSGLAIGVRTNLRSCRLLGAEGVGFEPTRARALPVFKSGAVCNSSRLGPARVDSTEPRRNDEPIAGDSRRLAFTDKTRTT